MVGAAVPRSEPEKVTMEEVAGARGPANNNKHSIILILQGMSLSRPLVVIIQLPD